MLEEVEAVQRSGANVFFVEYQQLICENVILKHERVNLRNEAVAIDPGISSNGHKNP